MHVYITAYDLAELPPYMYCLHVVCIYAYKFEYMCRQYPLSTTIFSLLFAYISHKKIIIIIKKNYVDDEDLKKYIVCTNFNSNKSYNFFFSYNI